MTVKARSSYGMALRGVRQALQSRSQAVKDETFTAVVLLSLFEDITGERNGILSSHTEGFQFLMKLRGQEQLEHRRGRDLFNFAYTHTHIEILAMGDKPRFNTEWILSMLNDSDPEHRLMVTSSKISDLLIEAAAAARSTQFDFGTLGKISGWIESGKLLDRELVEWSRNLPENWLPFVVYSQTGETLITYTRISIGAIWNYYRALRIVLQKLILVIRRILKSVSRLFRFWCGDTSQEDATMRGVVQEMITDIARWKASQNEGFPRIHSAVASMVRKVLDHVGSVQGIKLASLLASEGDNPFTLAGSLPMDLSTM
ncbi:hypothetical protein MW887_000519 [Aspergillus wentii]|nr:hypothetical protein MW887_000519 [Aspergillus wentii]